jgi:hypothetical protein
LKIIINSIAVKTISYMRCLLCSFQTLEERKVRLMVFAESARFRFAIAGPPIRNGGLIVAHGARLGSKER